MNQGSARSDAGASAAGSGGSRTSASIAAGPGGPDSGGGDPGDRIVRHTGFDRALHWLTALSVLVLLGTAFLPILGVEFAWVMVHWITGLVLTLAVAVHIVRALFWRRLGPIWIGRRDLADAAAVVRSTLRLGAGPGKPGKYSFAQKAVHLAFAIVVLTAIVTGVLMMVRIDTPWWDRNPYWLADTTWGVVYVLHGLAALCLITMIMAHVYFALRPDKWRFTRAMLLGWITQSEYRAGHDPNRWQVD
jgi:cytochrome b subunit of formate dehydrogenase